MRERKGFTLIELLVVIAIIALLMGILMPALKRVKVQAQAVACKARVKEWGLIFAMYTNDNNGYFHNRPLGSNYELMWPQFYKNYYSDPMMRCCPTSENPERNNAPFGTWGWKDIEDSSWGWGGSWVPAEGIFGSYGFSRYMLNNRTEPDYWKGPTGVRGADKVPVFLDCLYVAISPVEDEAPLPDEDAKPGNQMQNSCVNRHEGFVNCLFLDWSVRKVGLKELWTLKWHRNYDIAGPWTVAGGVQPNSWPEWMREFQDY
jgi:prepilin-type N-terminal cleavage/methylation domain-containing protein/prepilin-type processing-associated H-X9-DG protein